MSAIWGVWHRDERPLTRETCECMEASLSAYGTDRAASWSAGEIAVGCALAATLPEDSYDRQPLVAAADCSVLVADLRIDNKPDLLRDLGICTGAGDKMADSSLLQAAWVRWGKDCVGRLIGDFAFAVWDPRNRRIICARDHFGHKPFHYVDQGPLFAFASFPNGLYALPDVRPAVDETMVAIRLALLPEAGERSFFRNIYRLPPGHMLVADRHGVAVRPYWRPDPERRITFSKDSDYVENFRALFDEAVRCRLRSTGSVGSMLSGGFDSGSVSATAAGLLAEAGKPLTAFTAVPCSTIGNPTSVDTTSRHRFSNESHHATAVAGFYPNVKHVLVEPTPACFLDFLAEFRLWRGTPETLPSMLPYRHAMAVAIRQQGIKTVLSGGMGNITISYDGLPLLPDLIRQGKWIRWAREAAGLKRSKWMRVPGLLRCSFEPFLPSLRGSRLDSIRSLQRHSMIHPAFVSSAGVAEMVESYAREVRLASRGDGRRLRAAAFVRRDSGAGNSGASITGVDSRDPTADKRLAEFCLAVPDEQFLRDGQRKYLLRRAFAQRLPPIVLEERRKGMTGADWHLRVAPYRDRFAEAVERVARSPIAQSCLDVPRMRRLIDRWPRSGWSDDAVVEEYRLGLCRGLSVGDFICWVESGAGGIPCAEMAIAEASLPLFLASYPKSGNTWFRLLLANVKSRRSEPVRINSRFDRADVFVSRAPFDEITMIETGLLTGDEVVGLRSAVLPALAAEASPFTWFKTHEKWRLTPSGKPCFAGAGSAAVYVIRDPRDIAVSLAHHNSTSVDKAIDFMNDPDATMGRTGRNQKPQVCQKIGDWSAHVKSWLDQTDIPVHAVRYEALRKDTAGVFARALCFAGQAESRQDIERAVSHSNFSELRRQEDSVGFRERWSTTAPFFRRGEAGAWCDELTAVQAARIEAAHHNVMIRLGYLPRDQRAV